MPCLGRASIHEPILMTKYHASYLSGGAGPLRDRACSSRHVWTAVEAWDLCAQQSDSVPQHKVTDAR